MLPVAVLVAGYGYISATKLITGINFYWKYPLSRQIQTTVLPILLLAQI